MFSQHSAASAFRISPRTNQGRKMTLDELKKKRAEVVVQIRAKAKEFNDNGKSWKDDAAKVAWDAMNADEANLAQEIRKLEAADTVANRLKQFDDEEEERKKESVNKGKVIPGREDTGTTRGLESQEVTEEERCIAFSAWCRHKTGKKITEKHREIMLRCGIETGDSELLMNMPSHRYTNENAREFRSGNATGVERRNLSAYLTTSGGVLAPPSFLKSLEINMLAYGGIRQTSDMITTTSGERMSWPTVDDTGNQATRIGEGGTVSPASTDPTFGAVYWDAYKYISTCLVPYEILEDSFIDLPTTLGELMGIRLGRKTAADYTTAGNGNSAPKSLLTAATLGATAANQTSIVYADIINFFHSVDPAYRDLPGVGWLMNDQIIKNLRLIVDTLGRPIWQDGLVGASPTTLLQKPVIRSQEMTSTISSGKKTILFGKLDNYKIRRVNQIRFYHLKERYRDQDLDGFVVLLREDGNLLTAGTSPVKYLQH